MTFRGTFAVRDLDMRDFPFDFHNLRIQIKPRVKDVALCRLVSTETQLINFMPPREWTILGTCTQIYLTDPFFSSTSKVYW
jgi:hypothetical protein